MRTIKECIQDGCEKDDEFGTLPMALSQFIRSMALILFIDSHQRLNTKVPTVTIGDKKHDGKAIEEPTFFDYLLMLENGHPIRTIGQIQQLQGFMAWMLDQKEPEEEFWGSAKYLTDKWNEYAAIKKGGDKQ